MKCVILAGGLGTRISEESHLKPKPLIEIGGRPIIWHIMKIYSHYGINEFVVCLGYKGYLIKEYFANYALHLSDITIDTTLDRIEVHQRNAEQWHITLVDTGEDTQTAGRLLRVRKFVGDATFCFTYGDGLSDVRVDELVGFHRSHGKFASLTAIQPPARWGTVALGAGDRVEKFVEKPAWEGGWINGGFFVLEPDVFDYIEGDSTGWEAQPLQRLAKEGQLYAYLHHGFWQAMDTQRDKTQLEQLWTGSQAPWKLW